MSRTLILLFHRDIAQSYANLALRDRAATVPGVKVVDMQSLYPGGVIDMFTDAGAEAQRLLSADRIVLQFPVQWYSTPALLKAWQDSVLTRMFYVFAEDEGDRLAGTPLMVAATAGNIAGAYGRGGANRFTIDEIFTPLMATAHRCGLPWHAPYITFSADKLSEAELADAAEGYAGALDAFIEATPATLGQEVA
ncbi:NAD(P)H-dependent oxidoreductase [Salipiger mucosus]|uniref:NADH oxidoreductase YRKL n=1 Tax=Salipiger mucosus DSM 16094 TaxID=1123237 RepID=S9S1L5_9RHOB|nr:NAD(P)H-dependent oxidoreductase [Salipiger mucosus]EPX84085.1 NADH oxidoreductase YRKL [Salipiger mucosus DSM 16094]